MQSGYWQDLTTSDFGALDPEATVAVLPVAAVEQHGPHLPLATDAIINRGILERTLALVPPAPPVLALPALDIGTSVEHTRFPGTLSIDASTLMAAWVEVGRSVARAGVRKLVLFNSHGGQKPLVDLVALQLRAELSMLVVRASYFQFGAPEGLFDREEWLHGIHGGEIETSLLLHLQPEAVRPEALEDFVGLGRRMAARDGLLGPEKPIGFGWMSQDLNPAGVCGNAANADAERGAAYLAHIAERLAALLAEVAATPLDVLTEAPRP